jgi:GNAT superfamily N-acetyltransferase
MCSSAIRWLTYPFIACSFADFSSAAAAIAHHQFYPRPLTFLSCATVRRSLCEDGAVSIPERPQADGSVRLATTQDAAAIASIQADALRQNYSALLPKAAIDEFDLAAATNGWTTAISSPPSPHHRVFVAVDLVGVVGFAASAPAADADLDPERDAELPAFHVAPGHTRLGHGSRLMAAVVDHAHDDGVNRLVMWVFAADDPMRMFLRDNGWDADGSTRDLDVGELLHQVRMHTGIKDAPDLIA